MPLDKSEKVFVIETLYTNPYEFTGIVTGYFQFLSGEVTMSSEVLILTTALKNITKTMMPSIFPPFGEQNNLWTLNVPFNLLPLGG